jgi:hypothetical protein
MESQTTHSSVFNADEEGIRSIHYRMIKAWNIGDAAAFIAPFRKDTDFVAF